MRKILLAGLCGLALQAAGQDIHFSQFTQFPHQLNPANTGDQESWRANINYRSQWAALGDLYKTAAAAFDSPILKKNSNGAHMGIGLSVFNDKAGSSALSTTQANLSVATFLSLDEHNTLSAGIYGGYAQRSVSLTGLQWGNQYNGVNYDPTIISNEKEEVAAFGFIDAGIGVAYDYYNEKGTFIRDNIKRINAGFAIYHVNKPAQKFLSNNEKLPSRLMGNVSTRIDFTNSPFSLLPSVVYMQQDKMKELNVGTILRYRLTNATRFTGFFNESGIAFGGHYRLNDAIIPQFYYDVKTYTIGISYDLNISPLKESTSMQGGFEVSFKYSPIDPKMFGKRKTGYSK